MLLPAVVLLGGVLVGYAAGGRLHRLGRLRLRHPWLVAGAGVAQLAAALVGGPAHRAGLALSAVLVGAFLLTNRGLRGTGLVALGLLSNALVVGLNGAMPVSGAAVARAGGGTQDLLTARDGRHELADEQTRLRWLGDVIPVLLPVQPQAASPGDLMVLAGIAQLVVAGMAGGSGPRREQPAGEPTVAG